MQYNTVSQTLLSNSDKVLRAKETGSSIMKGTKIRENHDAYRKDSKDKLFVVMQILRWIYMAGLTIIAICLLYIFNVKAPAYACTWVIVISILAFRCLWMYVGYQKVYEYRINLEPYEKY